MTLVGLQTFQEINLQAKAENSNIPILIAQNSEEYIHKILRIHEREAQVHAGLYLV